MKMKMKMKINPVNTHQKKYVLNTSGTSVHMHGN
jgi:hypothetical protein